MHKKKLSTRFDIHVVISDFNKGGFSGVVKAGERMDDTVRTLG